MSNRILIVTNRTDIHADLVVEKIRARGHSPFRLNLDEFPAQFALDAEFRDGAWKGMIGHHASGETLDLADVGAVWTRKTADFAFASADLGAQEKVFANGETEHVLSGLLRSLNCYWMSHPDAVRSAMWKCEQKQRAARLGFRVPASLITNRSASALRFHAASDGDMVFKTLSSSFLGSDKVDADERISNGIATTRIGADDTAMLAAVEELPCFFQTYIDKDYELRVTIIDEKVFAAKIHSQDNERTKTDYRDFAADVRYEAAVLPDDVERRCREFVHSYGLTFGAIDLIVTPEGEHVFLENNPGGQFLFIEQLVPEFPLIDTVAQRLIEGAQANG